MIKRLFSLLAALHLALGPASAAVTAGSGPKTSRSNGAPAGIAVPGAASAPLLTAPAASLTPSLAVAPAPALAAIALAEAGTAESVRALIADDSSAADFVKAVVAQPHALDAAARAQAVAALGESAVVRLETAARALMANAAPKSALAGALTQLRRETGAVTPAVAQKALTRLIKEFGSMSAADAAAEPAAVLAAAPKSTRRPGSLRRYAMAAMAAVTLSQAVPAVAVPQDPVKAPIVLTQAAPGLSILLAQAGQRQTDYVSARDINDLLSKWSADKRLYVIGNPNIDAATLRQIAGYLADKRWTVVIVENASGERFTNSEGRSFYDVDAVDYGTGQGLYGKLAGDPKAATLTIVLQQRKLYLHGSTEMRANGVDVNSGRSFQGDLDQWAKQNLRNGMNVYGAVTETVDNIEQITRQAVASAAQSAQSAVAEAKARVEEYAVERSKFVAANAAASRAVGVANLAGLRSAVAAAEQQLAAKKFSAAARGASETARLADAALAEMRDFASASTSASAAIAAVKKEIDGVESAAERFRADHPAAAGALARPDLKAWRSAVSDAEAKLATQPRASVSRLSDVTSQVRAYSDALASHPAGAALIADAQKLHDQLAGRLRSGEGQASLTAAQQALRDARQAHGDGALGWKASLDAAQSSLASAERAIDAADAAAKTKVMMFWIFMVLGSLFTLGGAIFLNRRAARASAKAELALQKWDKILETKVEAIFGKPDDAVNNLETKITTYVGPEAGAGARGWVGETATTAAQIRKDSGYAKLLLDKAREVHAEATALVRPAMGPRWVFNLFFPSNFAKAEAKLSVAKVEFKPGDPTAGVSGRKQDWRSDLYGDAKEYEPFSLSFDALIATFNARAKAAVDSLDRLEHAVTQSGSVFNALDAKAAETAKTQAGLTAEDGLFAVPALYEKALPEARKQIASARVTALTDPIKGVYGGGGEAARIVDDAAALVTALTAARAGALAAADAAAAAIAAGEVESGWVVEEKKQLSKKAARIAHDAAEKPVAERVAALAAELTALALKAEDVAKGVRALVKLRETLSATEASVAAARAKIGAALGLEAGAMLTEKGSDPTRFIADSRELAERTDLLLGEGKLAEAKEVFAKAETAARGAAGIVAAGLESLETHPAVEQQRRAETERLDGLVPGAKKVLESIEKDFAAAVLALNAGDASHPSANGTVKDNVDEAEAAIEAATAKRDKALRAFTEGKVILAADLLAQVAAHQGVAQHRLDEITQKRARLDAAVAANKTARDAQEARVRDFKTKVEGDRRAMKPTLKALDAANKDLAAAAEQIDAAKGDPFKAAAALAAATAALDQVWVSARNDFDAYAEVERSLQAAHKQLGEAGRLSKQSQSDGTADSPAITSAVRELTQLEGAYRSAVEAAKTSHGDWNALDREADRVTNQAAHVAATLSGELAAAAAATNDISSAASKVREATNWSGSYGVYISGSPGSSQLDNARAALARGDYAGASRGAEAARRAAASAIASAEAEVERHRAEERRRREEEERERRRREQEEEDRRRRSSDNDSSSSWGSSSSGSSGSSWGSSSSGNSGSSW